MQTKRLIITAGFVTALFAATGSPAGSFKKIAQTGFQFLSVNSDGRASALAGAVTALELESSSLFFNPAGMAKMNGLLDVTASKNQFIADIQYYTVSLALRPWNGRYGVLGFSYQGVDYGEIQETIVAANDNGYLDTEKIKPSGSAVGIGYAMSLTDRFSVGGQIKYVSQNLGWNYVPIASDSSGGKKRVDNKLSPLAFDFGTQFKTGIKSLMFGMTVRNYSGEVKYAREGFQLPLIFTMGISMDLMDVLPKTGLQQSLMLSIDASHDRSHTSKAAEHLMVGLDYKLMDLLSIRGGYATGEDLDGFSFGLGVSRYGVSVDYSYTPFDFFNPVQRMTARFSM